MRRLSISSAVDAAFVRSGRYEVELGQDRVGAVVQFRHTV